MTAIISQAFACLLDRLQPNQTEVRQRKSHQNLIEQALREAFRGFVRVEVFGSHVQETAIHVYSDVDYLAVLGHRDVTRSGALVQSSATLARARKHLAERLAPFGTIVRISGPAIVLGFDGGDGAVDVVPGVYQGPNKRDGYPVFLIPDGQGGWRETIPQRHAKYLSEHNAASGYKLSRTVKLLKAWKYATGNTVPVLGFHLEMLLARHGICAGARTYGECLADAFELLARRAGQSLRDPLGVAQMIPCASTEERSGTVAQRAGVALKRARRALLHEQRGRYELAGSQWDLVLGGQLLAYDSRGARRG